MTGHRGWSEIRGEVSTEDRQEIDRIKRVMVALERLHAVGLERGADEEELAHALEASQEPAGGGQDAYLCTVRRCSGSVA